MRGHMTSTIKFNQMVFISIAYLHTCIGFTPVGQVRGQDTLSFVYYIVLILDYIMHVLHPLIEL